MENISCNTNKETESAKGFSLYYYKTGHNS